MKPPLAKKYTGMMISADGILNRIKNGARPDKAIRYSCGELYKHLKEMAERYYSGEIEVVDEFLQLYCLDDKRPQD